MSKGIFYLLLFSFFMLISCEYENLEKNIIESQGEVSYSKDIVPILTQHCNLYGCHVNGSATGDYTNYNQLKDRINSGKFQLMVFDLKIMPPATYPRLSVKEISMLHRWVENGALN